MVTLCLDVFGRFVYPSSYSKFQKSNNFSSFSFRVIKVVGQYSALMGLAVGNLIAR
ncbi:hypothetical protein ACB092_05G138800 [Castanea dentata]